MKQAVSTGNRRFGWELLVGGILPKAAELWVVELLPAEERW